MAVSVPGFEDVIPQDDLDLLSAGREAEYLQPLIDLGYLPDVNANLPAALYQFRKEYLVYDLIPSYSIKILDFPPSEQPETLELELLHRLTSLESDLDLPEDWTEGVQNIWTRVLHYRLALYGLFSGDAGTPLQKEIFNNFDFLKNWLQLDLSIAAWAELLGDFKNFFNLVFQKGNLNQKIVVFEYANPQLDADLEEEISEEEQDDDDEAQLALEEAQIDSEIEAIANLVSDKEEAEIEKLEKRNQPKRDKIERIRTLMQKTLDEMSGLLKDSLQKEEALKNEKETLLKKIETLKNLNQERNAHIENLKEKLKTETDKATRKKFKDAIESFEKGNEGTDKEIENTESEIFIVENKIAAEIESRRQNQSERQLLLLDKQAQLKSLQKRIDRLNFRFKAKLKRALDDDFYKKIKREIFEKRNRNYLAEIAADPVNIFLIRLVQLHQWTNGYYFGKLDADFKKRSFDSVAELCEDASDLRLKYVLTKLGDLTSGFWILNVHYFFEKILEEENQENFSDDPADLLEKLNAQAGDKTLNSEVAAQAWQEYNAEIKNGLQQPGLLRRVYYGMKIMVRSIFRCFEKLVKFIVRGIRRFITIFKNFIKLVYREIREAVMQFADGIAFLFSKRVFKTLTDSGEIVAYTDMDFDFDAVVSISPGADSRQIMAHGRELSRRVQNLNFSLVLTGKIIKWAILASQPISWPALAIQAAIFLRKQLKEWWKRRRKK